MARLNELCDPVDRLCHYAVNFGERIAGINLSDFAHKRCLIHLSNQSPFALALPSPLARSSGCDNASLSGVIWLRSSPFMGILIRGVQIFTRLLPSLAPRCPPRMVSILGAGLFSRAIVLSKIAAFFPVRLATSPAFRSIQISPTCLEVVLNGIESLQQPIDPLPCFIPFRSGRWIAPPPSGRGVDPHVHQSYWVLLLVKYCTCLELSRDIYTHGLTLSIKMGLETLPSDLRQVIMGFFLCVHLSIWQKWQCWTELLLMRNLIVRLMWFGTVMLKLWLTSHRDTNVVADILSKFTLETNSCFDVDEFSFGLLPSVVLNELARDQLSACL
ncbi:hypothetical protein FNV43_RR21963 [Rhamnella rubrinervis]|uniref:Uncharacterized protein n=1 Tax=Rhamnella rubrinervis TaxID=2594499 RepID=A0A8K0GRM1_9ROSA|nr:hypothetical protein FNV43_RR21963 [Rhamnella rubrinervis]